MLHGDFRRFWTSMVCSGFASQMVAVAVGWQVFAIHRNPFDLGLIGLAEFAPVPLGALAMRSVGGQAATIAGPALGGLLFAIQPELVYVVGAALFVWAALLALTV